ncbi:DNA sulfur modification protein DndB [Streptomyces tuirus]|uniref:Uncharacterized protein n=1 Tax=Streptomyces tuirus TaxID=68278 RepID=A0A7G1N8V0_9ACTN|nr:DNA sulfur modification protein DndB [Streptomyces tuirus]BCL18227.1 hypothetical protein GCM10017668_00700 [Streptomyces tuirus]
MSPATPSRGADTLAAMTRLLAAGSPTFKGFVEMESAVVNARSGKLFPLSALYYGNRNLLDGMEADTARQLQLADLYWGAVDAVIPQWEMVRRRVLHAAEVRNTYLHSHGIALHCLGSIGNVLLRQSESFRKWAPYLQRLGSIDWARTNPDWEGRALADGRIVKSLHHAVLATEYLRRRMGLPHSGALQPAPHRTASHCDHARLKRSVRAVKPAASANS